MADELAPEAQAPVAAPATPVAKVVNPVTKTVPLAYPIEFDGKTYSEVHVHRMSGIEVRDFVLALKDDQQPKPPCIDIPQQVYDALDDDDLLEVDKVVADFLPRRLRQASEPPTTNGDQSSPK